MTPLPSMVQLTPEEQGLYDAIYWDIESAVNVPRDDFVASLTKVKALAKSLLKRRAIPDVRWAVFKEPDLNVGGRGKSREDVFIENETQGLAILGHPDFIKHLHYFIHGPALPADVIAGFVKVIDDDRGTSGMVRAQLRSYVRQAVRGHKLDRRNAADEFFKLAYEIGRRDLARPVYDAAVSVRSQ